MHISNLLILAGALGVSAHPSAHAHNHQAIHARGVYKAIHNKPPPPPPHTPAAPAPPPAAATPAAPPPSAPAPAPPANAGSGSYIPFCGGAGKRATVGQIGYVGNTGNGAWGCNILAIDASIASQYQYVSQFTNVDSQPYQVSCWNKVGPGGLLNGFFSANKPPVTFNLAPGSTQHVAFDANSQGACGWGPGSLPTTSFGEWGGTWKEFDFGDAANGGWSGADCSSLVAQSAGLSVPGCQVCHGGTCSTILPGGSGTNAYTAGTENDDGLGLNIPPGPVTLAVAVGFSG